MSSSTRPHHRETTPEAKPEVASAVRVKETPKNDRISCQVQHTVNHDGDYQPANKQSAAQVQDRIRTDLRKSAMKNIVGLVEAVFHDLFLPVKPQQVVESEALRLNDEWTKWPRAQKTIPESEMSLFIELIGATAERFSKPAIERRRCSSMFENHPVPESEEGEGEHKPDLVFFKKFVDEADRKDVRWAIIQTAFEMKPKKLKKLAYEQLSRYVQCIFNAQPGRRFVPAVTFVGQMVTLCLFDRSGSIRGEAFNLHDEPLKFLRLILGVLFVAPEHLGFDTSVYTKVDGGEQYIMVKGVEYKVNCIYHEPGIEGRGTVCYHGVDQRDGTEVVIKDSWIDVARKETEISVLEYLNKGEEKYLCNSSGARVIPKIVAYEYRTTKRPVLRDGQEQLEDVEDTTAIFRESDLELVDGKPKWAWATGEGSEERKVEIRKNCRVVMSPFGKKLETFTSLKTLMRGLGDVVLAINILHDRRMIHRDISFRNILLHEHNGSMHGLLIDYDYAVSIDRVSSEDIAERIGTLPFMAIGRLRDSPTTPHRYYHDLESIFYVLCWLCTIYAGPRSQKRVFSRSGLSYHDTAVAMWNDTTYGEASIRNSCNSKMVVTSFKKDFEGLVQEFADYFKDITVSLRTLRQLLFRPLPDDEDEEKKSRLDEKFQMASEEERHRMKREYNDVPITLRPSEVVLESLKAAFEDAAERLPEEEPIVVVNESIENSKGVELHVTNSDHDPHKALAPKDDFSPHVPADVESECDDYPKSESEPVDVGDESYVGPSSSAARNVFAGSPLRTRGSMKRKMVQQPDGAAPPSKRSKTPVLSGGPSNLKRSRMSYDSSRAEVQKGKRKRNPIAPLPRRSGRASSSNDERSGGPGPSKLSSHSFTAESDSGEDGKALDDSESG